MLKEMRQELICNELNKSGVVSIDKLTRQLNASRSTIRRDIYELGENNLLKPIRGGAITLSNKTDHPVAQEPSFIERSNNDRDEKTRIAHAARKLISPNETLILAGGTTVNELCKTLNDCDPLYVVATDMMNAMQIASFPNIDLIVLGGSVRKKHYNMIGYFAESMISQIHADKAFLGVDAVDFKLGFMNFSSEEIAVNKLIIKASTQNIVLCDHTKFNAIALANICSFSDVDTVITGVETDPKHVAFLEEKGIRVILA